MRLLTFCAALLLAVLSACSTPEQPVGMTMPADEMLRFVPIDNTTVEVHWSGAGLDDAIVMWEKPDGTRIGELEATGGAAVIPSLDPGESYLVVVRQRVSGGLGRFIRARLGAERTVVAPASNLQAVSMSQSSIRLSWTAAPLPGATYLVGWRKSGGADSGSTTTTATTALVGDLQPGVYTFSVRASTVSGMSQPVSIQWAAATRYTMDAANPGLTLRMHEVESEYGPALIIDPARGGPTNTGVRNSDPLSAVALAIYTDPTFSEYFDIGPAYAFTGFRNADKFDSSTYISRTAFRSTSLDAFGLSDPLDTYINFDGPSPGNISAFRLPVSDPSGEGIGFVVRHGNGSQQHYARVFVKNVAGQLLQGLQPNRYVEVEISYQASPNVPFAKRSAARIVLPSTRRRF